MDQVDEAKNLGDAVVDRETEQLLTSTLTDEQITQQFAEMQSRLHACAQSGQAYRVKWRDVKAIIKTITTLQERLARAKQWQMDVEEREAAVCPEDVPFDEHVRYLQRERETLCYWLLRAYQSGHREGWEAGPTTDETMGGICSVLANRGFDPSLSDAAKELLNTEPRY